MKTLLKVSQQTLWQMAGKAVTSLGMLFILGLVTRNYGEAGTGIFTLSITYLTFFYLAADLGINAHTLPHFIEEKFSLVWQRLLGLRIVWGLFLTVLAMAIVQFWPGVEGSFRQSILFGSGAILGVAIVLTTQAIFQGKLRYDLSLIATTLQTLVVVGLVLLMTRQNWSISFLMLAHFLGWLTAALISLILVRSYTNLFPKVDLSYIKDNIVVVWPISLTLILNVIYFRLDVFILSYFKPLADVGVYNVAYQVFQAALVLPTFIMNSFYPMMLKSYSVNMMQFKNHLLKALLIMGGLAVLGTTSTLLLSPFLIQIITSGQGFTGSATALQILSLGFPAFFLSSVLMWTLVTLKKYRTMLWIYLAGLLFNVVANVVLIPTYSFLAASWVTVFSEYLILTLQIFILMKLLKA